MVTGWRGVAVREVRAHRAHTLPLEQERVEDAKRERDAPVRRAAGRPRKARRAGLSDQKTIKSTSKCTKQLQNVNNTLNYTVNSQNVNSQN